MQSSWDQKGVRILLAKRVPGDTDYNFIFFQVVLVLTQDIFFL
jgi:hypothetical protein